MNELPRRRGALLMGAMLVASVWWAVDTSSGRRMQAAADNKPPARVTLPVRLHPQETGNWCWAAGGQMMMAYFGKRVSQSEQANLLFERKDCGQRPVPESCNKGGYSLLDRYGFDYDHSDKPLSPEEIQRQLHDLRKPMQFSWKWKDGGGHVLVIVGYARLKGGILLIECLDPNPPPHEDIRAWNGGQRIFVTYDSWVAEGERSFSDIIYNVRKKP